MARVEIDETVQNTAGAAISGATVQVNVRGGAAATLYAAETGATTVGNPRTTDAAGRVEGWVDEGSYDLVVSRSGYTSYTLPYEAANGVTASALAVIRDAPLNVEDPRYGASPSKTAAQNSTALAAALAAIPAAGGDVLIPRSLSFNTMLTLVDGVRLRGLGAPRRFRGANTGATLTYTGTGQAVKIANASGAIREGVEIHDLRIDGTGLSGTVDGLLIDGTLGGADSLTEGLLFRNTVFSNFPRHQVLIDGLVFDIAFDHCSFYNRSATASGDLFKLQQTKVGAGVGYVGQISFWEPWFLSASTAASCCFNGSGTNTGDVRFFGGTVAVESLTTHGIRHNSGLFIYGTHVEGKPGDGKTGSGVGIRYKGAQAARIEPSYCGDWGTGVQIGDPTDTTQRATGAVIAGVIGDNATGRDIHIVAGSSRRGTVILGAGEVTGSLPTILNERRSIDGGWEIRSLISGAEEVPRVAPADAPNSSFYVSTVDGKAYFKDAGGVVNALY